MANILSQEEIDALLGGISGGEVKTGSNLPVGDLKPSITLFDFADQDRHLRGRMPTLETIHDRFATRLRLFMTTSLGRMVDVQVSSQSICSFEDYSRSIEKPSGLQLLRLDPLKGQGLLVLPARLILTLVDLMFGGTGRSIDIAEEREFTQIELRVIEKIGVEVCRCYSEAWKAVFPLSIEQVGCETNIQFVNIAQNADLVNVVDCDVVIESNRSSLSFCVPFSSMEPIKHLLKGSFVDEMEVDEVWNKRLRRNLVESEVELKARLGSATINGRDLLNLQVGDIIQLDEDYEHPIGILVEDKEKFCGIIGTHKSAKALQVTGFID
jgi:flagellar motor switch protein FliM